jgi:hypothetical protein
MMKYIFIEIADRDILFYFIVTRLHHFNVFDLENFSVILRKI